MESSITSIATMKKRQAHHPLRHLMVDGNGNKKRNSSFVTTAPLSAYLVSHTIDPDEYDAFLKRLNCEVITPFSGNYHSVRRESINSHNKYPLMIAKVRSTTDVVETINFCRQQNIQICLRAGGHSIAGYSVLSARMLIDVSEINGIFVDREKMQSTVGAGVEWGDYNHELDGWGLHNPGGSCSSVGMTGFTLGGGYGYTSMRWGMGCDNLIEVTVVTANGEIIVANAEQNEEILWASRGGTGGNFGVVVALKYQLYKLKKVWPIQVNWPIEDAAKLLTVWQNEMTKTLGDRKLGILGFLASSETKGKTADGKECTFNTPYFCIRGIYSGESAEEGAKALKPLLDLGTPSFPVEKLWEKQISYADCNETLLDNVEGVIPDDMKATLRSAYINDPLTEEGFQRLIDFFETSPSVYNIVSLEPYGGAINKVDEGATAFVHRNEYFNVFTASFWMDNPRDAFMWLDDMYESDAMKDLWSNNYYQNYPNSNYENWQEGYFASNYPRLQKIKRKWDPENVFNFEQSIEL
ncbi:MAG: FAD/FMN-containing dehydrogenase [Crocinitomicaceae bacterium]|jgi:FAD/FMN-containing dehydrogenase